MIAESIKYFLWLFSYIDDAVIDGGVRRRVCCMLRRRVERCVERLVERRVCRRSSAVLSCVVTADFRYLSVL